MGTELPIHEGIVNGGKRAALRERACNATRSLDPGWRRNFAICVLGAHRSGTSPVARVLNLLGVYLGAQGDLIPARKDNPTGFWEHSGLVGINERVLRSIGGGNGRVGEMWREGPIAEDGWESAPQMVRITHRAALMVRMHFGGASLWGWKDPRTSLTLPFWQQLVPSMRYVICVRNPVDATRSLIARCGIELEQGYELWLRYTGAALAYTAAAPRLVVSYESLLNHTDREVARLATFIGRRDQADAEDVRSAIASYLDEALWHHRTRAADPAAAVPRALQELYDALMVEATAIAEPPAGDLRFAPSSTHQKHWGERADVGALVVTHTEDEHRARYAWAAERVSGTVLDIACGTGHGSRLLARTAQVTGMDRDLIAVVSARVRVPAGSFRVGNVPPVPYADGEFDNVVSFETLEHIDRDTEFLAELRRVIAPGGHLLISTPNRAVTSPNIATPDNPFHIREYLLPDLLDRLRDAGFTTLDVYFQRKERNRLPEYVASAVIARVPWLCRPGTRWDVLGHGSGEVFAWNEAVTHPVFWVIDCS